MQVAIVTDSGEEILDVDEKSSFDDVCNKIEDKISKWQEYYLLTNNDTKEEITTTEMFNESIAKRKEGGETSVKFLCQPKYTFHVTDETDSKENEFSFFYCPLSMNTFEKFLTKIRQHCLQWDENCDVRHNAGSNNMLIVNDDLSLNKMIENCKNKQKANIFVCLQIKVCTVFSFWLHRWGSRFGFVECCSIFLEISYGFVWLISWCFVLLFVCWCLLLFCGESEKRHGGGRFIEYW